MVYYTTLLSDCTPLFIEDMINYCSFIVSYCRGTMDGQSPDRDFLNREINNDND